VSNKLSTKGCGDMVSAFVQRLWYREEVGKGESRKRKRQYCGDNPEQKSLHDNMQLYQPSTSAASIPVAYDRRRCICFETAT
jgi:hypothetical protein